MKRIILLVWVLIISFLSQAQLQQSLNFYADKCQSLKIGTAVGSNFYTAYDNGDIYNRTIINNFNILVAENEMKFDAMEPQKGNFNYNNSDKLVAYAQKYNMQLRGHNLCWHSQLPSWITAGLTNGIANGTFTRTSLQAILKNHINTIVTRYKGKVQQWDAVNEPFNDGTGTLRNSIWQQVIGNDYIDSTFVWAHRADPDAKLYLNEYSGEMYGDTKSEAMFNYVKSMKDRGIPITGVGFQCHFMVNTINFTKLDQNIKRYAVAGLEVIITELDIRIKNTDYNSNPAKWLAYQASDYQNMINICLNNSNAKTFVTWGFTDKYSWIPNFTNNAYGYSLIFDNSYTIKPAYTSILNVLATESARLSAVNPVKETAEVRLFFTNGLAFIKTDNAMTRCQLFDMKGNCLIVSEVKNNKIEIPLNNVQSGMYILKVQLENGQTITRKFIR